MTHGPDSIAILRQLNDERGWSCQCKSVWAVAAPCMGRLQLPGLSDEIERLSEGQDECLSWGVITDVLDIQIEFRANGYG